MKKYISAIILISIFTFISCSHKATVVDYKSASYDTSKQICTFYLTDLKSISFSIAPAKRIIRHYFAQDTAKTKIVDGIITVPVKPITDTIYLIATTDTTLTIKDIKGKIIGYSFSFRKPLVYHSYYIQETSTVTFPQIK